MVITQFICSFHCFHFLLHTYQCLCRWEFVNVHQLIPSPEPKNCITSSQNWGISFGVVTSGCFMFPRNSPLARHLVAFCAVTHYPRNRIYPLSFPILSGQSSICIPCNYALNEFSQLPSSNGMGSPSPHGHCATESGPAFSLPAMCFTSESGSPLHAIQPLTCATGRTLGGKCSQILSY